MEFICCNGEFLPGDQPFVAAANRGFRYGEGLFETMKWFKNRVLHFSFHQQRLLHGANLLHFPDFHFDEDQILGLIQELVEKNRCGERARIRWAVYRRDNGTTGYLLEASPLGPESFAWQEKGWSVTLYSENAKGTGPVSNLKSANYLLYLLAAAAAEREGVDESLVMNSSGHLCDGSRTNIFLVKDGMLFTPGLESGCVAGVMRRYLLDFCADLGIPITEGNLAETDLLNADEVFLTNAIQGIRWVNKYQKRQYDCTFSRNLFSQALAPTYL